MECFQWNSNYDFDEVCDELADVVIYCIQLANKINVDLETIVKNKMEKNKLKYPIEKAKGRSEKYDKL